MGPYDTSSAAFQLRISVAALLEYSLQAAKHAKAWTPANIPYPKINLDQSTSQLLRKGLQQKH
jgi:hypothetical protein